MLERFNPQLYTPKDAASQFDKLKDPEYVMGDNSFQPDAKIDQARLWSLNPNTLSDVKEIVDNANHVHYLPFIMGTYNSSTRQMRMNDFSVTDPYFAYLATSGALESIAVPFLRGFYFLGRPSWWRHESIHARHHLQMADFLAEKDSIDGLPYSNRHKSEIASQTIHESGIEEIVTRWQTLKEANGLREKAMSSLALALYMEYTPFTGLRNAVIDAKESTIDNIDNTALRRATKLGVTAASIIGPYVVGSQTELVEDASKILDEALPFSQDQIEGMFYRGMSYVGVAVIGAMMSSKEKGEYVKENEESVPTTEYKFPFAYNPVTSTVRSLDLLLYLNRVWDQIPNFRRLRNESDLDKVKREIDDRVSVKMSPADHTFTMRVVEDALKPVEKRKKSQYPGDVYVKGMFTPAMYLNLRERYYPPAEQATSPEEHEVFTPQ